MTIKDNPIKISTELKVIATAELYDDEASEETLRCYVEQDLEDAGFNVEVELLKKDVEISSGKLVRCKDCIHNGNSKKCILAAVAEIKNCPVFLLDNNGEWFCADGKRKE